jgi:sterol carrier protein 2
MSHKALIAGVGMVKFTKPSQSEMYDVMASRAAQAALGDAGINYRQVQQAYAGYVSGDTCSGQTALYSVGMTGIPVINVNNACASGTTAIYLAREAILGGRADVVLAVGFEQMGAGALSVGSDRTPITWRLDAAVDGIRGWDDNAPQAPQYFGGAGAEYLEKYGESAELFAKVSVKARQHAARNPYAVFTQPITLEEVMAATPIFGPLTKLMCCPPTCGAAAVLLVSEDYARKHGIGNTVEIAGMALATDTDNSFSSGSMLNVVGAGVTRIAAATAYEQAGVGPEDIDLVELHDCFSPNEVISYESLGLCPEGGAARFIADGDNTYGGRVVTNPSGGLLSKGHPLGATGPAQFAELTWHLRGTAGDRQVPDARIALQHNIGLGGAGVVSILKR